MNIFVRNIAYAAKEQELRELFEQYGSVDSCKIIKDKETGKSKGYGFVEMPEEDDALDAINNLNGLDLHGRVLAVQKAREKSK
jgi:RNA recognition motif-containing protein